MRRLLIAHYGAWRRRGGPQLLALAGVAAGVASASGSMTMLATLSGTAAGVAAAAAAMTVFAFMSGTAAGTSTAAATCTMAWEITYASMTFSRASQGSYLTQAPTTGSSAFISVASNDVLRTENRGDGVGGMILLEGSRTNSLLRARELENSSTWTVSSSKTGDAGPGPDGATSATRLNGGTNTFGYAGGLGLGVPQTFSTWARSYGSGQTSHYQMLYNGGTVAYDSALTNTYKRFSCFKSTDDFQIAADGYDRTGVGGLGASIYDVLVDYAQTEAGRFPSSVMPTTTSTFTRAADTLTLASASVPPQLFTGKGATTTSRPCSLLRTW